MKKPVLQLPFKPTLITKLNDDGLALLRAGASGGLVAFCGSFDADPIDTHLAHKDGELVQVCTVPQYHGFSDSIQPGVTKLVLAWPKNPPVFWWIIGWLENDRVRPLPIPHHQFNAFRQKDDERTNPNGAVETSRINVVRP